MNMYIWIGLGIFALLVVWFYNRYKGMVAGMDAEPSKKLVYLTDKNFKKQISQGVVLVDFWADWCQPCKILGPIVSEVADEIGEDAIIAKLDVQNNPKTSQELMIRNIPTIIIFKNGKPFKQFVGVKTKKIILKALHEALGK